VPLVAFVAISSVAGGQTRPIGISHVTVVDVEHGKRLRDYTVIVEGNRIATVGPSSQVRIPDGYGVVEGRGKFIMPGLIDAHRDVAGVRPDALARRIASSVLAGVTGVVVELADGIDTVAVRRAAEGLAHGAPLARTYWRRATSAATDTSTGADVVEQMRRSVAGGLTTMDALRIATLQPARDLGWGSNLGTVAPNKLADFLILDANPLDDVANVRQIAAVVFDGRFIDGEERARLLSLLPRGRP
jgi:imidazolonepropionase-like amidohydrolase